MNWNWTSITDDEATNEHLDMAESFAEMALDAEAAVVSAVARDNDGAIINTAVFALLDDGSAVVTIVDDIAGWDINGNGEARTTVLVGTRTKVTE